MFTGVLSAELAKKNTFANAVAIANERAARHVAGH